MIKVLIIHSTTEEGGLTRVIYNICKELSPHKVNFCLLLLSPQHLKHTDDDFKAMGVSIIQAPSGLGLFGLFAFTQSIIQQVKPHIIHTHGLRGNVFGSLFADGIPHVTTLHGNMVDNYSADFGKFKGLLASIIHMFAFAGATVQTLVSSSLQSTPFISADAVVIPNGVETKKFFAPTKTQKKHLKLRLGFKEDATMLVYIGSIITRKSVFTLLDAFCNVSKNHPQAVLCFIGKGSELEKLKEKSMGNQQVKVMGFQANIPEWFQASDVYLSPSLSEGLPNAALEALGCGLPLVLSDIPPHREVSKLTGAMCKYFEPKNVNQLAQILDEVLGKPIIPQTVETISIQQMAEAYYQLYKSLL